MNWQPVSCVKQSVTIMCCFLMTFRPDLLELSSAMFHTGRQPSLEDFFAGKEKRLANIVKNA